MAQHQQQQPLRILISGAGVAGSALALILARHPGFQTKPQITLIERSDKPRSAGQAIDIRDQGVEVIRQLGLEPAIRERHTSEKGFAFVDTYGRTVARFDATGDEKKQSITSEYEILRSEMVDLLLEKVEEERSAGANVRVMQGESVAYIEETEMGVHVTFRNNQLAPQVFDVVLGADGTGSKTRSFILEPNDYREPTGLYMAFFTIPRIEGDDNLYRLCVLPGGLSLHLRPHRDGKHMSAYLAVKNAEKKPISHIDTVLTKDVATQKAFIRDQFSGRGWQADRFVNALDKADDFYFTHWCKVVTPRWTKGRIAILGDAAFATHTIGTSMSFMSAYIIAGELSKITSSSEVPTALERYEATFRPFVKKTESYGPHLRSPQTVLGIWILHMIMRMVAFLGIHKLSMASFGGVEEKEGWQLPDYGFEKKSTKKNL